MDLDSIAPATEIVTVAGHTLEMRGLSNREVRAIKARFPKFLEELNNLFAMSPETANAMLAASIGKIGDAAQEKFFDELPVAAGIYLELCNMAIKKTWGPFEKKKEASSSAISSINTAEKESVAGSA